MPSPVCFTTCRRRSPALGPCSPMATSPNREEPKRGTGWAEAVPIRPPEGVGIIDRMVDAQDRAERAKAAKASGSKE